MVSEVKEVSQKSDLKILKDTKFPTRQTHTRQSEIRGLKEE